MKKVNVGIVGTGGMGKIHASAYMRDQRGGFHLLTPRIGCYAVYECTEEGWEYIDRYFIKICSSLRAAGLEVIEAPEFVKDESSAERVGNFFFSKKIDMLHVLVVTWSFDHLTYMIWQQVKVPVAIRTIPGIRTGSMVGGQQLGALLTDIGIGHKLLYGNIDKEETINEIEIYAKASALKTCLSKAKFAMLGRRTLGMTPIAFDEMEILGKFGSRVTTIGMDEFSLLEEEISQKDIEVVWEELVKGASEVSCSNENGIHAVRRYLAIKKLASDNGYNAITIGSYPGCQGTSCLPVSLLNRDGIPAGCEGDMNSTIAMYILSKLSDEPVHFGEMLELNEEANTVITSHCGAAALPLASEDGYILSPVRLANNGTCVRFKCKPGPVTYVNMVGRRGNYRMCAFEGEAIETDMVFEGNPMKIRMDIPLADLWRSVSENGFGHHWMAAYGHMIPVLREFCGIIGIKGVFERTWRIYSWP